MPAYRFQMDDRPLEGYTIQHALGRGGFGEVYFAISDAGREVALKAIQNHEEIELRGLSHCMNLKSPHLVMIFDVKQDADGMAWVIMEYVSGASLREILDEAHVGLSLRDEHANPVRLGETDRHGIGTEQATYFIRELCKGLSYLHDAGVVHRDLKPHNVFFEDGVVKIGDYSLSKAITTSHRSGHTTTVGSVHYMAPEIGEGRYDKTVDIYALGVILFEMLTGAPPYEGESMGEVLMKHLSGTPDVSGLPSPFDRVVAKAMRRDPDARYQTASEMLRDLASGDEMEHSRPPASLSLIGERAAKQRANRAVSPISLADTFATPTALRETHDSVPFVRPFDFDLHSIGLWWRKPSGPLEADTTSILVRFALAAIASVMIVPWGCALDHESWFWGDTFLISLVHVVWASISAAFLLSALPHSGGFKATLISRMLAVTPVLFWAMLSSVMPPQLEYDEYFPVVFGLMATFAIIDVRCLLTADRYPRVGLLKTLIIGGLATAATAIIEWDDDHHFFAGAIAMSTAIVFQLIAPHGRKLTNQSQHNTDRQADPSIAPSPVTTEPTTHQEIQC